MPQLSSGADENSESHRSHQGLGIPVNPWFHSTHMVGNSWDLPKTYPPTHPHTHTREKNWNPRNQRSRIYAHGWPQRWSGRKPVDPYRSPPSRHGRHLTPALVSLDTSGFSTAQRDLACAMTINCQRNASCMFKPAPSQSKTTEVESPVGMFQAC